MCHRNFSNNISTIVDIHKEMITLCIDLNFDLNILSAKDINKEMGELGSGIQLAAKCKTQKLKPFTIGEKMD